MVCLTAEVSYTVVLQSYIFYTFIPVCGNRWHTNQT